MIDVVALLRALKIAPRAVFDNLPERGSRVRFMIPTGDGDWRAVTWGAFASQIRRALPLPRRGGPRAGRPRRRLRAEPRRVDERGARDAGRRGRDGPRLRREHAGAGGVRDPAQRRQGGLRRHAGAARPPLRGVGVARRRRAHRAARRRSRRGGRPRQAARRRQGRAGLRRGRAQARALVARARHRRRAGPGGAGRVRADDERRLARSARGDALHERHLRQPQGRAAHPPQRGRQRARLARLQRAPGRRGRGGPALAADEPHLRLRRGLPRQHARLHELPRRAARGGGPAARGPPQRLHERALRVGEARRQGHGRVFPSRRTPGSVLRRREAEGRAPGDHRRPPQVLPLRRRGAEAGGEGALPPRRYPRHRGLRPHRRPRRRSP